MAPNRILIHPMDSYQFYRVFFNLDHLQDAWDSERDDEDDDKRVRKPKAKPRAGLASRVLEHVSKKANPKGK